MSTRYSQVVATRAGVRPEPSPKEQAIIKLLDTETLVNEAIEQLVRFGDELMGLDGADALLGDAMRRIALARSVINEMRRAANGQPTIASVG